MSGPARSPWWPRLLTGPPARCDRPRDTRALAPPQRRFPLRLPPQPNDDRSRSSQSRALVVAVGLAVSESRIPSAPLCLVGVDAGSRSTLHRLGSASLVAVLPLFGTLSHGISGGETRQLYAEEFALVTLLRSPPRAPEASAVTPPRGGLGKGTKQMGASATGFASRGENQAISGPDRQTMAGAPCSSVDASRRQSEKSCKQGSILRGQGRKR